MMRIFTDRAKSLKTCSRPELNAPLKTMYPDWLSLTGDGYVAGIYKKYNKVVSPMGCRAFLSPWYEKGGMNPADDNDKPVYVGRFNVGAVSLNLPMIYAKAEKKRTKISMRSLTIIWSL